MHIELWLMHRSCVPDCTRSKKSLHPGFLVPTIPSLADQILRFAGFDVWTINGPHCTTNTLPLTSCGSQYKAHLATAWGATLLSPIHNPPCRRRNSIAGPWRVGKISWAPCIRAPSAPCGIWRFFWRWKAASQRRGESQSSRLVLLLGALLLGGDVKVGSWWKLKKWFNSDAFVKGDLTSLGKSVVKIRKMMFYSVFFL